MAIRAAAMAGGNDRVESRARIASGAARSLWEYDLGTSGGGAEANVPVDSKGEEVYLVVDGVVGTESGGVIAEPMVWLDISERRTRGRGRVGMEGRGDRK